MLEAVAPRVTVRRLLEWWGRNLGRRWEPYHILQSNCQHLAHELQSYVRDPNGSSQLMPSSLEEELIFGPHVLCAGQSHHSGVPVQKVAISRGPAVMRSSSFGSGQRQMPRAGSFNAKAAPQCSSFDMGCAGVSGLLSRPNMDSCPLAQHGRPAPRQVWAQDEEDGCVVQ